jgi:hypothetical protein
VGGGGKGGEGFSKKIPWSHVVTMKFTKCSPRCSQYYLKCMGAQMCPNWGMPNVPKKSMMGQSIWLFKK